MTKEDIQIALDDVKNEGHLIGIAQFLYGLAESTGNSKLLEAAEVVQVEIDQRGLEK